MVKMISKATLLLFCSMAVVTNVQASNHFFYADWSKSTCVGDETNPPQHWDVLYGSFDECCDKVFWWNQDCKKTSSPPPTTRPTSRPRPRPINTPPSSLPASPTSKPFNVELILEVFPSADAFVDESQPRKNFGSRMNLHIRAQKGQKGRRDALLKFDISSYDNVCVEKVTLSLYSLTNARSGGVVSTFVGNENVFAHSKNWKEDEATWHSMKSRTAMNNVVLNTIGRVKRDSWVTVDVSTGVVKDSVITYRIISDGSTAKYASKERSQYAPMLSLILC